MSDSTSARATSEEVTRLLRAWSDGDREAADRLMPLVYDSLRGLASGFLRHERRDLTLETRNLVNEAYLRLVGQDRVQWRDRAHFFAIAGQAMRRILVDHARRHESAKRGGGVEKVPLVESDGCYLEEGLEVLDLHRALDRFAQLDPQAARLVELRYFGGLTQHETAEVMGISSATVIRRWRSARAWLHQFLLEGESGVA